MFEAVALVCFMTTRGPVCVTWHDERNPYSTFEACDKATDHFLEQADARYSGMGAVSVRAGCVQSEEKES